MQNLVLIRGTICERGYNGREINKREWQGGDVW